jgi:multiple sugar transport system permease protein
MSSAPVQAWIKRQYVGFQGHGKYFLARRGKRLVIYAIAFSLLATAMIPLLYTLSTALSEDAQITLLPPKLIPAPLTLGNFVYVFEHIFKQPIQTWFANTTLITGINIVGQIFFAATAAYGFARFRFRLRRLMFVMLMASIAVPWMVKLLPQYLMFSRWDWVNTFLPLTVPTWFSGAFLTFLFYQFFVTIPRSLDESALLDGATSLEIFFRIVLPLSTPILATAVVLTFITNWSSFIEPYIYLHTADKYTVALVMAGSAPGRNSGLLSPFMAAFSLVYVTPIIVLFFALQKYFVQGIQLSIAKE